MKEHFACQQMHFIRRILGTIARQHRDMKIVEKRFVKMDVSSAEVHHPAVVPAVAKYAIELAANRDAKFLILFI